MLLRKNGRGAQHHDLLAVLGGLECRADRDLGLAVAHVAADQAVHRLVRLHVGLHVGDRRELVERLLERERGLHLELPRGVLTIRIAVHRGAARVEVDQVECERACRLAGLACRLGPVGGVEASDPRGRRVRADELGDAVDLLDRHVELVALGVLEKQVVAFLAEHLLTHDLLEERDAVGGVHHVVAGREGEGDLGGVDLAARTPDSRARVDIVDGDDRDLGIGDDESGGDVGVGDLDDPLHQRRVVGSPGRVGRGVVALRLHAHAGLRKQVGDAAPGTTIGHREGERVPGGEQRADAPYEALLATRDLGSACGKLGVDAGAGAEDREQGEPLPSAEVELGGGQVESVERDARSLGKHGEFFSATNGVVEQRTRLRDHGQDVGAEILGGHAGTLVEQREERFDPVEEDTLLEQLELMRQERVLERLVTKGLLRVFDAARADAELSAGKHLDRFRVPDRLAGRGHVALERLDLVAEQLRAHRRETAGGKDVEHAAAYRELARVLGDLDALVAHAREPGGVLLEVDGEPGLQRQRIEDVAPLRRHGPQKRTCRGDNDDRAVLLERVERAGAGPDLFEIGSGAAPRVVAALRVVQDAPLSEERRGLPPEALGVLLARDDHERRARLLAVQGRDDRRPDEPGCSERGIRTFAEKSGDRGVGLGGCERGCEAIDEHGATPKTIEANSTKARNRLAGRGQCRLSPSCRAVKRGAVKRRLSKTRHDERIRTRYALPSLSITGLRRVRRSHRRGRQRASGWC